MNVVIFADGDVGEKIVSYLISNYIDDLIMVITASENNISVLAKENEIETHVFYKEDKNFYERLPCDIDLGILAWWPHIITKKLIKSAKQGFINTHPSYLPFNRGKNYNFWALVEQVPFGVSIHFVDLSIDSGAILLQKKIPYDWTDNGESLYKKASSSMVDLFQLAYIKLKSGHTACKPQDISMGSFHQSSELEQASQINLEKQYRARDLLNLLRARTFSGHPSCWFVDDGSKYEVTIKIKKVAK
ncbi:formyltransferase family protein [Paraglaciecola arctica]|uniref:Formyl transferase N-terminal domain-containing protein n=1 Tax=Paraglaciecola arctica BSs20135 TaxID=493475 RepID=K6XJK5_9ALTE|nr:formyltransferase family protein [Paraglaciecola arctica]GAC20819.1 hypothetical protein GARC_3866 [Paraglaciecola arctica BSs20135]|tara:strand:+ start:10652 stop:11389 length:738 start_codon:yes stop_codon:yes gene_type:complete